MESHNKVQWVYASKNTSQLSQRYDQWATNYDVNLEKDFAWEAPQRAVEYVLKHVPSSANILDAGAGTGLVGNLLSQHGYKNLTAIDISQGMLDIAADKGIYRDLRVMTLGDHLSFPSDQFDAVTCVGVLTVGHAPVQSLYELVRVTKPGGHVIFSMRPDVYETAGFKETQASLESQNKWYLKEVGPRFFGMPKGEPDVLMQIWVYQIPS